MAAQLLGARLTAFGGGVLGYAADDALTAASPGGGDAAVRPCGTSAVS
ncbi:hypothetical protein ACH4E7_10855 [Kitasatospora sp. NPDC018058]